MDVIERDDADAILVPFLNISGRQVPWSKVEIALFELGAGRRARSEEGCQSELPKPVKKVLP